jgi:hypothetical protein
VQAAVHLELEMGSVRVVDILDRVERWNGVVNLCADSHER